MKAADEESHRLYGPRREQLFSAVQGRVVELGPGTGVNFPFLPCEIHWIGIEPNPAMHAHLREKAEARGISVDLCGLDGNALELEDASADFFISTLVLCSVPDVDAMLSEIHRVLVPGGTFLFIEHVAAERGTVKRFIQKGMNFTPWRYFSDGCNPGRDLAGNIAAAGFVDLSIETFDYEGPGIIAWVVQPHIWGSGRKGG